MSSAAPDHVISADLAPASSAAIDVRDLGRMAYLPALAVQRQVHQQVVESRDSDRAGRVALLLVEHDPPVITISRRPGARQHLVATDATLRQAGIEVAETDRGGDITYHGPGQLVVYPILDLNQFGFRINTYMRFLEQVVLDLLARHGIEAARDPDATGVWVNSAKICAMGVRVSRWVSMHGLALNVTTNLDHFNLIVPCGLAGRSVTSLQNILGPRCPAMSDVKSALIEGFGRRLAAAARVHADRRP